MKKVIYTCITNNYDTLLDIEAPGWQKICFTDSKDLKSNTWDIVRLEQPHPLIHREVKICPYKFIDYDLCVWLDGRTEVTRNFEEFISDKTNGIWLMKHPDRDCIYKEANACVRLNKADPDKIQYQMGYYAMDGYPHGNGLVATGVIVRANDPLINKVMGDWYRQLQTWTHRDQLSFNYVAWDHDLKYQTFPFNNGWFNFHIHNHKKKQNVSS